MRILALISLFLPLSIIGCSKSKTTNTMSSKFTTLAEKQEFLERYVTFRRSYDKLHYNLSFIDGGGIAPGPTEWDVRILAIVPSAELDQWVNGLTPAVTPALEWTPDIPHAPKLISGFEWYEGDKSLIGINRATRMVLYRNNTF